MICLIQDNELVILALTAGYRSGANCESRKTKRFAIERGKCGRGEADYLAAACAFSTKQRENLSELLLDAESMDRVQ